MLKQNLSREDLRDAITIAANRKGIPALVIEKDFWITWCLKKLFSLPSSVDMIFKGGTSLSKGYHLISRLSEDCDLTLNRATLGFTGDKDPLQTPSNKKREKLLEEMKQSCANFVQVDIKSMLQDSFKSELGGEEWRLEPEEDPQSLRFYYPQALEEASYSRQTYVPRSVLLEFGIRGDIYPVEKVPIRSYLAEELPNFAEEDFQVPCLSPLRTFWEKATLLHAEHHRPLEVKAPERLSRHYYDISMLFKAGFAEKAMHKPDLLHDVVKNKTLLFRSAWAKYDEIETKGIRLLPPPERLKALEIDYNDMRESMLFGEKPSFESLMEDIIALEKQLKL